MLVHQLVRDADDVQPVASAVHSTSQVTMQVTHGGASTICSISKVTLRGMHGGPVAGTQAEGWCGSDDCCASDDQLPSGHSVPQKPVVVQVHGMREAVQDAAGRLAPIRAPLIVVNARLAHGHMQWSKADAVPHQLAVSTAGGQDSRPSGQQLADTLNPSQHTPAAVLPSLPSAGLSEMLRAQGRL